MSSCELCGKEFKFPYLLLRHLNKKNPCSSHKVFVEEEQKVYDEGQKVYDEEQKVYGDGQKVYDEYKCGKCEKVLSCGKSLKRHEKTCKGVHVLQCPTCMKVFSSKASKYQHLKNVKCSSTEEIRDLEEEILALKKENAILKSTRGNTITTNNNNTNINNYTIKYELKYDPETRCLTTDDPDAPFPELLCFNGFKQEAARSRLKNIDQEQLQDHIDNVRIRKDYYSLYTFFFRNVDNRRLQMFNLGKNNNTTHAQVFNNGAIEKVEKSQLFENVCRYIGQYLLNMSIENADVITMLTTEQASKTAFLEVTKDSSHMFQFYKSKE
jgi:hypothetical protein